MTPVIHCFVTVMSLNRSSLQSVKHTLKKKKWHPLFPSLSSPVFLFDNPLLSCHSPTESDRSYNLLLPNPLLCLWSVCVVTKPYSWWSVQWLLWYFESGQCSVLGPPADGKTQGVYTRVMVQRTKGQENIYCGVTEWMEYGWGDVVAEEAQIAWVCELNVWCVDVDVNSGMCWKWLVLKVNGVS